MVVPGCGVPNEDEAGRFASCRDVRGVGGQQLVLESIPDGDFQVISVTWPRASLLKLLVFQDIMNSYPKVTQGTVSVFEKVLLFFITSPSLTKSQLNKTCIVMSLVCIWHKCHSRSGTVCRPELVRRPHLEWHCPRI